VLASFRRPRGIALDPSSSMLYVAEYFGYRLRSIFISSALVQTVAGSGSASFADGWGIAAAFSAPLFLSVSSQGILYNADFGNNRIRQLTCVPCPASFFCSSGAPVLCPPGSFCPLSSLTAMPCPMGSFSPAGASSCSPCPAGTFTSSAQSSSCLPCPVGHFCPQGTSSWARLNCGRGFYCPAGSAAPTACPLQVPPSGGWGAQLAQGPAFLVETARCLGQCFYNASAGGSSLLGRC
jgi:hypothetical protein